MHLLRVGALCALKSERLTLDRLSPYAGACLDDRHGGAKMGSEKGGSEGFMKNEIHPGISVYIWHKSRHPSALNLRGKKK